MNGQELTSVPTSMLTSNDQIQMSDSNRINPNEVRAIFGTDKPINVIRTHDSSSLKECKVVLQDGTHVGWGEREAFDFALYNLRGEVLGRLPLVAMQQLFYKVDIESPRQNDQASPRTGSPRQGSGTTGKRFSSGKSSGSMLGRLIQGQGEKNRSSSLTSNSRSSRSNSPAQAPQEPGEHTPQQIRFQALPIKDIPASSPEKEKKPSSARRLSEWQLKLRHSSKTGSSQNLTDASSPAASAVDRRRSDSVDYTPDGLSPALQDSGYDPSSKHKPMGLAGLLGDPDDDQNKKKK